MTLDEAIEHATQIADSYKDIAPACKCAHEHRQLADWLTELKILRTENIELRERDALRKWYARMLGEQTARVVNLQELAQELYEDQCADGDQWKYRDRMRELGVTDG